MADGTTPLLGLTLPEVGLSYNTWGEKINADMTALDTFVGAIQPAQLGGTGLVAAIGGTDFIARAVAVGVGLDIADGDGVAGDPTVSFDPTELTAKALPVDADEVVITDSAAGLVPKKATRVNLLKAATLTAPRRVFSNMGVPAPGDIRLDCSVADYFVVEMGSSQALGLSNPPDGKVMEVTLVLISAGYSVSWLFQTWLWPGGVVPTPTATGTDVFKILWTGTGNTVIAWRVAADVK